MATRPKGFPHLPALPVPLFACGHIYLCRSREEWVAAHKALGSEAQMLDRMGAANTFHGNGAPDIYLLGVFADAPDVLAHEAAHLVFDICGRVGVRVAAGEANETFCYLLGAVVAFAAAELGG